ncbi:MAG: hypothetical protein JSV41_11885 [Gemmatimonadota bacterium]|nr:MAG: hypothetical protein JSV41_11885 [Gemmatimonadota bacterium]
MGTLERIQGLKRAIDLRARLGDQNGLALVATILVLALVAALAVTAINGAMTSLRTTGFAYRDARAFYASEAGGEYALGQIRIALRDGFLSDEEVANLHPPEIEGFNFDSFTVWKQGEPTVETITDGPYAGLYSLTQKVEVYARVEDPDGNVSAVLLKARAQAIPIFQFGVFFEEDLEATNGPPMEFVGRVHSNGNIYLSSKNAWYREIITTPNQVIHDRKDHHQIYDGVYINDAEGNEVQLDFDSRTIPGAEAFKAESCEKFDCRLQTHAFDVDSLSLPLPEGVLPYELVRPREESDGAAERQVKYAWNADMYVTVNLSDIRGKSDVCSGNAPSTEPDEVVGYVEIAGLQPVVPGEKITFKIGTECGGDDEFHVTVKADGVTFYSTELVGSCTFSVTIPSDADVIEIIVNGDGEEEEEGGSMDGSAFWYDLQSLGTYDPTPWPDITVERTAGLEMPSEPEICDIFRWKWSAFYDGREQELKDVLDIDINQLSAWVGGDSARASRVIYVEFVVPGSLGGYSTETFDQIIDATLDPAIRLVNGKSLPNELTVATEWPLYVRGDYNSVFKRPASLASDGITILSNDWDDADNRPHDEDFDQCKATVSIGNPCYEYEEWANDWGYQNAGETTVNAAILAGHWPTPCDHDESGCPGGYDDFYGGGIENFPRFLERWRDSGSNKVVFHYSGALISPFTSQKTTGTWNGTYYVPPQRDWSFDTDFRNPQLLPPATPNVGNVLRTGMREAL